MKLKLVRHPEVSTNKSTIGSLFIDGLFFCDTLEDFDRHLEDTPGDCSRKVYGVTCIPKGIYQVIIDWSNHFGKKMPHILDVPCFTGIRIHIGNRPEDTEGCILLGQYTGQADFISHSADTFQSFLADLLGGLSVGEVTLEVT